uniref:Uncharacterized protein Pa5G0058 n=1 Tax=Podospora anserina TaxID=2587412 RepID=Q875G3_PODAS|nr:unnamed protein product [Podospora anserina]
MHDAQQLVYAHILVQEPIYTTSKTRKLLPPLLLPIPPLRHTPVLQPTQEARVQPIQIRVLPQRLPLSQHIFQILPNIKILAPQHLLPHPRCKRNTHHPVQIRGVIIDIQRIHKLALRLRRKSRHRFR